MDDDKPGDNNDDQSILPPGGQRKRPAPTIDLKATDVSDVTDNSRSVHSDEALNETEDASNSPSPGWRERLKGRWASFSSAPFRRRSFASTSRNSTASWAVSLLVPALTGAATAALIVGGAFLAGWPAASERSAASQDNSAVQALDARVASIESKTASPAQGASPAPALATRITALEASLASLKSDIGKLRAQNESTLASLNALKSASPDAGAPPQDISAIEERITKLERATVALTADAPARVVASPVEDTTLPRIAAATLLDQAVRQGEPFDAALANAKKLDDSAALKALEPLAATGVSTASTLSRDLLALLPLLEPKVENTPATGGFFDRLQQSASKLVRVRRVDEAGSERANIVARVKAAAQREDIAEAKAALMSLPEADRAPFQKWLDKADAREAALGASRHYAQDAMTALPKPAASGDPK